MSPELKQKITETCEKKIKSKGGNVGISFYAFFKNKNDNPDQLMEAAEWWIKQHKLDHFEKAIKILSIVDAEGMGDQKHGLK